MNALGELKISLVHDVVLHGGTGPHIAECQTSLVSAHQVLPPFPIL